MATKYAVVMLNPKQADKRRCEIVKDDIAVSADADTLVSAMKARNPGFNPTNIQKITYDDVAKA